jgi:predicted transcriptional regulator
MAVMSTKIPDDLKARVDRFPHINWSEIMRSAILEKLIQEEQKEFHRDPLQIDLAITEMDALRRKAAGNSTEELRKWREQL